MQLSEQALGGIPLGFGILVEDKPSELSCIDVAFLDSIILPVLLDKVTRRSLYLGLVDTIFAYAYNHRTTLGENNVRWTHATLTLQ